MPTSITLQPDFFDPLNLLYVFGLVLLITGLKIFFRWNKQRRALKKQQKREKQSAMIRTVPAEVKVRYQEQLRQLGNRIAVGEMAPRAGYQQLSLMVRSFVKEYAGVDVTTRTLEEIRYMQLPVLTALVEEYYAPEFSPDKPGDVQDSITKTIRAINAWK